MFWIVHIIYPITFGDLYYESYYHYGGLLKDVLLTVCAVLYFSLRTPRAKSTVLLMLLYNLFTQIADAALGDVSSVYYMIESLFFTFWAVCIMTRPEISTPKTINKDNILLAFYRGEKGSLTMHFFELFGLPFKSMSIIAGDNCLKLKSNKDTFQFSNASGSFFRRNNEYYIYDTGKPYTKEFVEEMAKYGKVKAMKNGFRTRCIEAVGELLAKIGEEYRPTNPAQNAPSIYFGKIIRL